MGNDPEEVRQTEKNARMLAAKASEVMLRYPSSRWAMTHIRNIAKWIERNADEWLKGEGWR